MQDTDDQLRAPAMGPEKTPEVRVAEGVTIGKFKIIRLLAEGGMGAVFLAEDVKLRRKIAVKKIRYQTDDPESRRIMLARFDREARGAGRLSHPNVVTVLDYDQVGGQPLLIMEYVDGHPLRDELQGGKALPPARVAKIVIDLLKGLEAIHEAGLIHRDLKPANVMLTREGDRVKILDLGLVKFAETDDPANEHTAVTKAGVPMGTGFYMSPEQINARPEARAIDGRADIYAVGVMCYHLLTGKPPFDGIKAPIFDQHRLDPLPEIVSPFGELSPALKAVVHKAAAKKPCDRFQTAKEMRQALERLLAPPAQKRGGTPVALALVGLVLAAAAVFALKIATRDGRPDAREAVATEEAAQAPKASATAPVPAAAIKDTSKIAVAPPPADEAVPTTQAGCQAYEGGRTGEAETILTKVVATSPDDADALYCLCGAYARKASLASSERATCEAFLSRASQRDGRKRQVRLWLNRGAR